jgi:hypothetical protein
MCRRSPINPIRYGENPPGGSAENRVNALLQRVGDHGRPVITSSQYVYLLVSKVLNEMQETTRLNSQRKRSLNAIWSTA